MPVGVPMAHIWHTCPPMMATGCLLLNAYGCAQQAYVLRQLGCEIASFVRPRQSNIVDLLKAADRCVLRCFAKPFVRHHPVLHAATQDALIPRGVRLFLSNHLTFALGTGMGVVPLDDVSLPYLC